MVIGDVMLDTYIMGNHVRQSPEADIPILDYSKIENRLGGAANVANNLRALGHKPFIISTIGHDETGQILSNLCDNARIKGDLIKVDKPTTLKTRFVNKDYAQFLRLDKESKKAINKKAQKKILSKIKQRIKSKNVDAVILQDYNKGLLTKTTILTIQSLCKKAQIPLCVDPKYNNFKLLSNCDVFKPNLQELNKVSKESLRPTKKSLSQSNYVEKLKCKKLFVTLADKGIYSRQGNESEIITGHKVNNADVSGAGDTVISVLTILHLMGMDQSKMAVIANKAGAIICKKKGVSTLKPSDLKKIM